VTQATIGRSGKNLALRFPAELVHQLHVREGDRVEIISQPDQVIVRRATPNYTIETLFAGKSPAEWRALYAGAYDWGPDIGREIIDK
jgi:antitoxin MazE